MDKNGQVAFRSLWANDTRALEQALQKMEREGPQPIGEKQTHVVPMLRGLGCMHEILEESGPVARHDVLKQMSPMDAMARLARMFKPLPPMGRSLAAMSVSFAALGLIGWAALRRRAGSFSRRLPNPRKMTGQSHPIRTGGLSPETSFRPPFISNVLEAE